MSKAAILCVDDERIVLDSLKHQLSRAFKGLYTCEFAEDPQEALEIIDEFAEDGVEILVIVSDWLMPIMRGDEFLIQVHRKFPKIVKIMLTGQADPAAIERARREASLYRCLYKPWERDELIGTIQSGLAQA